jgi:hypothetical protein
MTVMITIDMTIQCSCIFLQVVQNFRCCHVRDVSSAYLYLRSTWRKVRRLHEFQAMWDAMKVPIVDLEVVPAGFKVLTPSGHKKEGQPTEFQRVLRSHSPLFQAPETIYRLAMVLRIPTYI